MAIITKKGKKTKYGKDHSYSGFWMDRGMATSTLSRIGSSASNTVKALKLRNYQRAIGNFVKILSRKDVPVYVKGTESYTDFDHVVIAANVSDKNFDVTAALALHEASHLKYTTKGIMESIKARPDTESNELDKRRSISQVRGMFNWIEDRRIDTLVFKSCPGYKAYYHKLYDHYFRNKEMGNMLMSKMHCQPEFANYMNHIMGMLHPVFDSRRMPGLGDIVKLIDVNNIGRLKTAEDALALSEKVVDLINELVKEEKAKNPDQGQQDQDDDNGSDGGDDTTDDGSTEDDGSTAEGDEAQKGNEAGGSGAGDGVNGEDGPEMLEDGLSPSQYQKVQQAIENAKKMINGDVDKKRVAKSLAKKLKKIQNADIDVQKAGTDIRGKSKDVIIFNIHRMESIISELVYLRETFPENGTYDERHEAQKKQSVLRESLSAGFGCHYRSHSEHRGGLIQKGMEVGAMLGKKMLTRREDRQLITNRLRTGKIDSRRIAHAGYGIETVFNQINIDTYKNANIHLTIDASGSMTGERWDNTIKMSIALAKAVSMIKGLEIQISGRETDSSNAAVAMLYDSRVNKLVHLVNVFKCYEARSMTPEGLCLEGMLKSNLFVPQTQDCDSYMINICDGAPGMDGYGGWSAIEHTRRQVKKINNLGINHIGYFFGDPQYGGFANFKNMYGVKQSIALKDANNATEIAKHMNKELMSK